MHMGEVPLDDDFPIRLHVESGNGQKCPASRKSCVEARIQGPVGVEAGDTRTIHSVDRREMSTDIDPAVGRNPDGLTQAKGVLDFRDVAVKGLPEKERADRAADEKPPTASASVCPCRGGAAINAGSIYVGIARGR